MSEPLFVHPADVGRATASLRRATAGHGGGTTTAERLDGAAADAAILRLVQATAASALTLASNLAAIVATIDDAVVDTFAADGVDATSGAAWASRT